MNMNIFISLMRFSQLCIHALVGMLLIFAYAELTGA